MACGTGETKQGRREVDGARQVLAGDLEGKVARWLGGGSDGGVGVDIEEGAGTVVEDGDGGGGWRAKRGRGSLGATLVQ